MEAQPRVTQVLDKRNRLYTMLQMLLLLTANLYQVNKKASHLHDISWIIQGFQCFPLMLKVLTSQLGAVHKIYQVSPPK